jgi:hypothetical protein
MSVKLTDENDREKIYKVDNPLPVRVLADGKEVAVLRDKDTFNLDKNTVPVNWKVESLNEKGTSSEDLKVLSVEHHGDMLKLRLSKKSGKVNILAMKNGEYEELAKNVEIENGMVEVKPKHTSKIHDICVEDESGRSAVVNYTYA